MLGFEEAARLRRAEHFLLLRRKLRTWLRDNSKWVITAVLFSFCIGPIFISYTVYLFEWAMRII
jgi:hypothetical protein